MTAALVILAGSVSARAGQQEPGTPIISDRGFCREFGEFERAREGLGGCCGASPIAFPADELIRDSCDRQEKALQRYRIYQADTLRSLELMRNPATGWIRDKIEILPDGSIQVLNNNTSATNIGLDILNQLQLTESDATREAAARNLDRIVASLESASFHPDTGLFYSWYSTDPELKVVNSDVSSVDNIHLALALWTLKEHQPGSPLGKRAGALFSRMDFSAFLDPKTGLAGGNLKHADGKWTLDIYRYSNLGSEARSVYSLGWALGLFKKSSDSRLPERSLKSLHSEVYSWRKDGETRRIMRTWDGGAFQLLLPRLLINEDRYSSQLDQSFNNYAEYIVAEGDRQGFPVPAAHSASNYGVEGKSTFEKVPTYHGKAGSPALVSSLHRDLSEPEARALWDAVHTPHAAVIAATADPFLLFPRLEKAEGIRSGYDALYRPGLGFMDGLHVKGPYQGRVVPVQLSLDQGMIALALSQIDSKDGLSVSARALRADPVTRARLTEFYRLVDRKLADLK